MNVIGNSFIPPQNLSKSIVLEAAELLENFQWNEDYELENLRNELEDILIYSILLADILNIDLVQSAREKLNKNNEKYPVSKSYGISEKYNKL